MRIGEMRSPTEVIDSSEDERPAALGHKKTVKQRKVVKNSGARDSQDASEEREVYANQPPWHKPKSQKRQRQHTSMRD